jgi:hygromycin-B 4-O-kinase
VPEDLEVGEAFDGVYAVSELVLGSLLEELDTDGWLQVVPSLFEVLEAVRRVKLRGAGFGRWQANGDAPYSSWRDWLCAIAADPADSRIQGWRERMATIPRAQARFDVGNDRLVEAVEACPEPRHVVHSDLTAGNVLVEGARSPP